MDKEALLKTYMTLMYGKMDSLRQVFPSAMSPEIIQMERGFRYCAQESSKWIEELLDVISSAEVEYEATHIVAHSPPIGEKKKNKFVQVLAGGSKDMMSDLYKVIQGSNEKKELQEVKKE